MGAMAEALIRAVSPATPRAVRAEGREEQMKRPPLPEKARPGSSLSDIRASARNRAHFAQAAYKAEGL